MNIRMKKGLKLFFWYFARRFWNHDLLLASLFLAEIKISFKVNSNLEKKARSLITFFLMIEPVISLS